MSRSIGILAMFLLLLGAIPLLAQDGPEDEEGRRRLEDLRRIKLIEALDLTEEQSIRLFAREKDFREKERQHLEKRKSMLKALESKVDDKASDDALREHIQRLHEMNLEASTARRDYLFSLSDILSMQQLARMVIFEQRFAQEVKRLIQRSRKGPQNRR